MEPCKSSPRNDERKKLLEEMAKKKLYDSRQACEILHVSLPSLRRAIARGQIKTTYIGKFLRIPSEELEKFVGAQMCHTLSVPEVADLLNVGMIMVRKLIKDGSLKATRLTKTGPWRISFDDYERFLQPKVKD